jgi:hypothetical protein
MKIIFVESFDLCDWNGYIARNIKGVSGSHTAPFYLAESLASMGNECIFVSIKNNMIECEYLGVQYINYNNFQNTNCDYIVTTNNFMDLLILNKIYEFNKIIMVTPNEFYNLYIDYVTLFNQLKKEKIIIAYISEFAKSNILYIQPFLNQFNNLILYNSIDILDIKPLQEKENAMVFFACVDRGLKLVYEIMKKIDNFILYHNNYNLNIIDSKNNKNIQLTNDTSKYCIFNTLSKCKYFIYPLINLDNNLIHYDTFGYVVLEALLHGVIVIAPKIQVYEELYGDAICYIDTSDIIEKDDLSIWKNANNDNTFSLKSIPNFGYPCIDKYIEKVNILENDEYLRNSYIEKGLALKEKFSSTNIANHLLQFLEMNN